MNILVAAMRSAFDPAIVLSLSPRVYFGLGLATVRRAFCLPFLGNGVS